MTKDIRPATFDDFIGQKETCKQIKISIDAAKRRDDVIDHVLLSGPPGLGKTTISKIIANCFGTRCVETIGNVIKTPNDLITSLVNLGRGDVLFVDEIHAMPINVQEYMYTAMEDYRISHTTGGGSLRRMINLELKKFVLVGATTMEGLISAPMRDRFGLNCRLFPYEEDDIAEIVKRAATKEGWRYEEGVLALVANRARATPRVALKQYRRIKDMCTGTTLTMQAARDAYDMLMITEMGLTRDDRTVLKQLAKANTAVGLDMLSALTNIHRTTIEQVVEPHLMRCGLVMRSPRGRIITDQGKEVIGA